MPWLGGWLDPRRGVGALAAKGPRLRRRRNGVADRPTRTCHPGRAAEKGRGGMRSKLRLAASLLATVALALIGATAVGAGNPHTTYTCTKPKKNGETEVRVSVPEPSVGGLTNAGFTCVTEAPASEDEDEGQATDTGQG